MRDLTPEECEFIAGGLTTVRAMSSEYDPPEIVVVASPPPYYPPPYYPPYEPPSTPPPPPTGGGGSGGGNPSDSPPPNFHGLSTTGESIVPFRSQPHMAQGTERGLTQDEKIALAGSTNLTPSQLDAVRIHSGGQFGNAAATTWSGTNISFDPGYAITDFSKNPDTMDLLVHELYHVYQYDTNTGYARMAADEIQANTGSHDYYTYTSGDLQSVAQNPSNLASLNVETQASIAEDYYRVSHGLQAQGAVGFNPSAADLKAAIHF